MGFCLRIVEGKAAGRDFLFSQQAVRIGRAPENDLVLYDMGVSRFHTEILQDDDQFSVRDVGSANGTVLNDEVVTEAHIVAGDRIKVGPVVFEFQPRAKEPEKEQDRVDEHDEVFSPSSSRQRDAIQRGNTTAYRLASSDQPLVQAGSAADFAAVAAPEPERRTDTGSFVSYAPPKQRGFRDWPLSTKLAAALGLFVLIAGIAISAYLLVKRPQRDRSGELFAADRANAALIFGSGPVDVFTPDRVNFRFDYEGGRVTVLYAVGGIETASELAILLNNKRLSYVDPSPGRWTTGLKLELPRHMLRRGVNILTFDNTRTPASEERWGVAQVRVKEEPLPPPDEQKAKELYDLGKASYDARSVAPPNLYRAIKYFEDAQLYLEAMQSPPALLSEIRESEQRARAELQKIFDSYLFASEKALRFGQRREAVESLRDLLRYLPDPEDPRRKKAKSRLNDLVRSTGP